MTIYEVLRYLVRRMGPVDPNERYRELLAIDWAEQDRLL